MRLYRPRVLRPPDPRPTAVITARQAQVLDALCDGMSNPQIADQLFVTEDTIKTQVRRLLRALGADNRTHAVALVLTCRVEVLVNDPRGERTS